MKKLASFFCLTFIMLSLAGCGTETGNKVEPSKPKECEHNYVLTVVDPTCTEQGYSMHKCSLCNDSYKDTYKDAVGHNYVEDEKNYKCQKCGKSECDGFTFKTATYDGEYCYVVTGVTTSALQNDVLEVPRKYESLPVRGIMNWAFSSVTKKVKKIIIHDNIKNIYSNIWHGTSIYTPDWETKSTLEEVVFDSTCKDMRIEAGAFNNCPNLSKVNIAKGMVKYAPADAVLGSSGGNAEWIFKDTKYYTNSITPKNGFYYIADLLVHADPNEISSSVSIDKDTVLLNAALFARITFVKSVTIPKTVKSIGEKCFYGCSQLETITFEGTVSEFKAISIGVSAFSGTKAKKVICSDGEVTSYYYNGWTYNIGD